MRPLFLVLLLCLCFSCKQKKEFHFIEGFAQGTTYHITYQGEKDYTHDVDSILKSFDMSLSAWVPTSLLSRINQNDSTVVADKLFTDVFNKAREVNLSSEGMFDITVGPLIKAWGFYDTLNTPHDSLSIHKLLKLIGMDKVSLKNGKILKNNPGIVLDVNAIAQGYSVDVVCDYLQKKGLENYLVEIGGELRATGHNREGEKWKVGIDKPIDNSAMPGDNLQVIIDLSGKALATSGDYRKFKIEHGIKYAHHVNPKTGYPSQNRLLSVSVIADDCITADAYGTACMVLGLKKGLALLNAKKLQGYFIFNDEKGNYQTFATEGFAKIVHKEDDNKK